MKNQENTAAEIVATVESKRRGRPAIENSIRQQKIAARAERAAQGISISRGRPSLGDSKRQAKLAERAAKIAAGISVKAGRPAGSKKVKAEPVVADKVIVA